MPPSDPPAAAAAGVAAQEAARLKAKRVVEEQAAAERAAAERAAHASAAAADPYVLQFNLSADEVTALIVAHGIPVHLVSPPRADADRGQTLTGTPQALAAFERLLKAEAPTVRPRRSEYVKKFGTLTKQGPPHALPAPPPLL